MSNFGNIKYSRRSPERRLIVTMDLCILDPDEKWGSKFDYGEKINSKAWLDTKFFTSFWWCITHWIIRLVFRLYFSLYMYMYLNIWRFTVYNAVQYMFCSAYIKAYQKYALLLPVFLSSKYLRLLLSLKYSWLLIITRTHY